MSQNCFIGIDQGSSSTKAIAISEQGQVLFQTKRPLPVPAGDNHRVEFDARTILASVQEALKETIVSIWTSGFVPAGIGLSCQRSSCLVWEESTGEPLSPVLSWRDRRGSEFTASISGEKDSVFGISGLPLTPYYSASKLRWLRENISTANKVNPVFGTLSSFLVQRLTNAKQSLIDHTQAARTQLMNIRTLAWDPALLSTFGIAGAGLPRIAPVVHDYGEINTPAGPVPLDVSIGDQQAAMIGLGVLEPGDGGINYGTGGFLMVNTGKEPAPAKGLMASILYSTGSTRHYLLEGSVNAAGDALEWIRGMGLFREYAEIDDLCWQAANDVVFFVGLNGTGAPYWENAISSSIHGLSRESAKADIIRAAVENIAFFMKDIADEIKKAGFEPAGFSVSGGLSSLTYLAQVQADLLDKEMRVSGQQEVSALGAALLAGIARGAWSPAAVKKMAVSGDIIEPRHNAGAEKRHRRWMELHRMTKQLDEI
jgi:glycerol kinase